MKENHTPNHNVSLSSLALLSLQLDRGKDYLDYLQGFVNEALRRMSDPTFDSIAIQSYIEKDFELKIPVATIALYLKRLQKTKQIERTSDGHQYRILTPVSGTIQGDREAASGRINEVISQLMEYASKVYSVKWNKEETSVALSAFVQEYSIDFVRFSEFRSPLPVLSIESASTQFIVASFIQRCAKEQQGSFESIKTLVESHILANALLCPEINHGGSGFKNVVFVLDTRLLLKAFDLESDIDTANVRGLLATLRQLKGTLCVFPETIDEIRSVLRAIIGGFQSGGARGPVVQELRKRNRGVAEVLLVEAKLEEFLRVLDVSTLQAPPYDESNVRFQIDEDALRTELVRELGYESGRAADHDVRAVRNIYALRRGRRVARIEEAGHVFLTTNAALSRAAYNLQRAEGRSWVFSAVITDYHLSHLAWLKSPAQSGDLTRTEILASCHAAMRPPETLWRAFITEVDRLKVNGVFSEKDYEVLRLSLNAPEELMDVTRGEVDGITEQNLRAILSRLEASYAADKEQKLAQVQQEREETQKALEQMTPVAKSHSDSLLQAAEREEALKRENEKNKAENQRLKALDADAKKRDANRTQRINRIAERTARIAFLLIGLAFAAIGAMALFSNWSAWLGIPAAIVGFFNLWSGFSGNTVERWVKSKVAQLLSNFMS